MEEILRQILKKLDNIDNRIHCLEKDMRNNSDRIEERINNLEKNFNALESEQKRIQSNLKELSKDVLMFYNLALDKKIELQDLKDNKKTLP